jgi:precorrin-3B methylase
MDKRKSVWADCWNCVQEYLKELATYHADKTNVVARDRYKQALKRIRELMHEERELSAVARACVLSSGDPRVTGILQSA